MRISLTIPEEFKITNHGYGQISREIVASLQRLGHEVPFKDPDAQVELAIGQPYHWSWSNYKNSYKIGLVAWESTKVPDRWRPWMKTADEVWTPSPVIADVFEKQGIPVAQVYEHGIDKALWRPRLRHRSPGDPIRFLHIGSPAPRKGGQESYDAFKELFGNSSEATLTIKAHNLNTVRGKDSAHPDRELKNVKVITEDFSDWEMYTLVRYHDVLLYPGYGEGFGLIPLQAMFTGMPVICTEAWAPYKAAILRKLRLGSKLGPSPWPEMHPGEVWYPDLDDLRRAMRDAVGNYNELSRQACEHVPYLQIRYDWDRLTAKAFEHIERKFG